MPRASPSATNTFSTSPPNAAARGLDVGEDLVRASRSRYRFSRYMSQYVQWFHEQPIVACRMKASASLGGR